MPFEGSGDTKAHNQYYPKTIKAAIESGSGGGSRTHNHELRRSGLYPFELLHYDYILPQT